MRGHFVQALAVGTCVTAAELFIISRFNRPAEHLDEQQPERKRAVRVAAVPPPQPLPTAFETPSPLPIDRPKPAPTPMLAPSFMPELNDAHAGVDLATILPNLTGLRRGPRALRVGTPASSGEHDGPAVPRDRPAPRYPEVARRRGIEGHVIVRMRVDETGRVTDVVVVEAEPPRLFDLAAKRAARRYTFQPARSGGKAVATTLEQRILFRLR